jgi:hypothetical protein
MTKLVFALAFAALAGGALLTPSQPAAAGSCTSNCMTESCPNSNGCATAEPATPVRIAAPCGNGGCVTESCPNGNGCVTDEDACPTSGCVTAEPATLRVAEACPSQGSAKPSCKDQSATA